MTRTINNPDPRREYQRGRILAALKDGPLTAKQLGEKVHLSRSGITIYLSAMQEETPRLVRIVGYFPSPTGQRPAPMYGLGSKPDAKYVRTRAPKGKVTAADRKKQILKLLAAKQMTGAEVNDEVGLKRARIYVLELYAEGSVHIAGWQQRPSGGSPAPVYAAGSASDAPRPTTQTVHEKCARAWAKLKADPHRHGLHLKRNRLRKNPQTWLSALMG
jgi:predicted ArsR family transcriptional regulator